MTTTDPAEVQIRRAATVMLLRDGPTGLEVLMLRRNPSSVFVGGAHVFPGGAVDPLDLHDDLARRCAGRTDPDASAAMGLDSGGLAFWIAAIRECFEESGVLLAYDAAGEMLRLDDPATSARFAEHRHRLDHGEMSLVQLCELEGLTLACDSMHYASHWITPVGPPRRYDTRFFVARAPEAQVCAHDGRETVETLWTSPADALHRCRAGELQLVSPTVRSLESLALFDTADEVVEAARAEIEVPAVRPRILHGDGGTRTALPGDPGYEGAAS